MDSEDKRIKDEIEEYKLECGFIKIIPCSNKENKEYEKIAEEGRAFPENVKPYTYYDGTRSGEYYKVHEENLSFDERLEYLAYKKLSLLQTIRNCVIALLIIGIVLVIVSFSILFKVDKILNYVESVEDAVNEFSYDLTRFFNSFRW